MTLSEIRVLLRFRDAPQASCAEVTAVLEEHIGHVATRIQELRQLQTQLRLLRQRCNGADEQAAACGILNGLGQATAPRPGRRSKAAQAHVHGAHGRTAAKGR